MGGCRGASKEALLQALPMRKCSRDGREVGAAQAMAARSGVIVDVTHAYHLPSLEGVP